MGERRSDKVVLIGLDGFSPSRLERLMADGRLPALARLRNEGADAGLISTLPANTPVAWASITTGAWPATHGVEGFLVHRPGDPFDRRVSGCYSTRNRSEPIWETATRHGLRSAVVKFPVSYPSTSATFRLDGAAGWGGLHCLHELVPTGVTDSGKEKPDRTLTPEQPWEGEPATARLSGVPQSFWRWLLPNLWGNPAIELHVAVLTMDGESRLVVATEPDWFTALGSAVSGDWSDPLPLFAADRRGQQTRWNFRVRPLGPLPTGEVGRLRLLNTTVHEQGGHSAPAPVWDRYAAEIGPIEEQTEPSLLFEDEGIDVPTLLDVFRLNADWLTQACDVLLRAEKWDLFLVHAHFVDWAHHAFEGGIDPRHPDFDPSRAAFFEEAVTTAYVLADRLVAAVREAAGPGADVIVVGDHGQDLAHTSLRVNELLAGAGLLTWAGSQGDAVDWSATQAYAQGNYVYVNTFGRDPEGVVMPKDVPALTARIVDLLLDLSDPGRGGRPVLIAGPKEEFQALGADGEGVGDVVFCMRSGYQARNDRGAVLTATRLLREFTGGHDHLWPYARRVQTRMLAAGPSFRPGHRLARARPVVDVASTLAGLLGIPAPPDNQGHPMNDLLVQKELPEKEAIKGVVG